MSVFLESIKFNHDPTSANADALSIRKNASDFVSVPEWIRSQCVNPEDSPAAYSIKETQGNTLSIQAQLHCTDQSIQEIEVRAIDPYWNLAAQGCIYAILVKLGAKLFLGPPTVPPKNILGDVKPKKVTFQSNGYTDFESFELINVDLSSSGVGIGTVTWNWQYRTLPDGSWLDLITTVHRIYSLLELPKSPWLQSPYNASNIQLPWTDVMDYACNWAMGKKTLDTAACAVTQNVFNLGPSVVTYDCPGGGGTHYANSSFNCTAFIERLHGGLGNGQYVNCTDCATIVSTFANVVGCDLWQSRMGYYFDLNPILAIGSNVWETACDWGGFRYHEVAWKGACNHDDGVFDACLKVDGDPDPTTSPHIPEQPCNMRFGNTGDGQYRDKLAAPPNSNRENCAPRPDTQIRRTII